MPYNQMPDFPQFWISMAEMEYKTLQCKNKCEQMIAAEGELFQHVLEPLFQRSIWKCYRFLFFDSIFPWSSNAPFKAHEANCNRATSGNITEVNVCGTQII